MVIIAFFYANATYKNLLYTLYLTYKNHKMFSFFGKMPVFAGKIMLTKAENEDKIILDFSVFMTVKVR